MTDALDLGLSSATLSPDGLYRYHLTRRWAPGPRVCWVMLNSSTADADRDDPTLRRCIAFSKAWGFGSLEVVNLFGLRSPYPRALLHAQDPIGPDNRVHVERCVETADRVVLAWGALSIQLRRLSGEAFIRGHVTEHAKEAGHLGTTKDGDPRHPLYVEAAQPFITIKESRG